MPNIPVHDCCGCTACYNACPTSAIKMVVDSEGFRYPEIDPIKCCNCGKCERVCPIISAPKISTEYTACVIAQHKNDDVLDESTSGGFVDELCRYVLEERKGYVAGVVYDENFMPKHTIVHSYAEARAFRNSKYAQSDLGDVFHQIRQLLLEDAYVMFIGTPCQVAGLTTFLNHEYDKLITVDLVCRSIPSPKLWREYLNWQEKRYDSKVKKVFCRKKTYGYHSGTLVIEFENGKQYSGSNRVDYYMKSFHGDICSRPSCYDCHFKTKHRCSDFTVFDCWKPEMVTVPAIKDNDHGFSNVLVHTQKGAAVLTFLNDIQLYESNPNKLFSVMGSMADKSIVYKKERDTFYRDFAVLGFEKTVQKYCRITVKDQIVEFWKPICYFWKRI